MILNNRGQFLAGGERFMTDNSSETVTLSIEGRIAYLGLNRPNVMNAMDLGMLEGISNRLKEIKKSDAEVLIIYGHGKGFSAGGDIRYMLQDINQADFYSIMNLIKEMMITLYTLPKLVISSVHGAAAGLGFGFALATDYIIAEESTVFAINFIHIGLIPDGGSHFFLNMRLGEAKAKQLIWEGKNNHAKAALEMGLINEIAEDKAFDRAKQKANEWLKQPIKAMIETKMILTENNLTELERMLDIETIKQFEMRQTKDHKEGIQAFLEKRKPSFKGE